ncbi:MAG: hypothetical protein J0G96_11145 [Flavobacteriia bacterium]|nr:hypothetical protein [Flavobacteriia bacterium]OJX37613.1 MAG: hypothetical protein BGO87_11090 [Flavobacteriia bacterium 40-80]
MRITGFIIAFFTVCLTFGQRLFPTVIDTNRNARFIDLDASAESASTTMNNSMLNRFLFGGTIESGSIDQNFQRQKMLNTVGAILSGGIVYTDLKTDLFKHPKLGYGIQIGYDQIASVSYTDHLFGLMFKGNEQYAGMNMDLSSTVVRNIAFQKVGFGIILKPSRSSLFLNVVNVSDYFKGGVGHGTIQQSSGLDSVTLDVEASMLQPYKSNFFTGTGLSLDFNYNIPIRFFRNSTAVLQVQFRNLGVAYVEGGIKRHKLDTIHTYTGFTVDQLFDGVLSKENTVLDTLGVKTDSYSKWIGLPFYFQFSKAVNEDYEGKFQSLFGLRVYPISSYKPLVYLGVDYRPIRPLHIGLMATYGGFSTFRGTLYVQYMMKNFGFGAGCDNIVGSFSQKGFGQTYNLKLTCRF